MGVDIIIPSIKTEIELAPRICDMEGHSYGCRTILALSPGSAAHNRNLGLEQAMTEYVIMIDDDIRGWHYGWWAAMIKPLIEDEDVEMVSARLVNFDGTPAAMMAPGNQDNAMCEVMKLPTAAVAFRNDGIRFDEAYIGSGFEDDDFCMQLRQRNPHAKFIINNTVRLIHENEMKNQGGEFWEANQTTFNRKWAKHAAD